MTFHHHLILSIGNNNNSSKKLIIIPTPTKTLFCLTITIILRRVLLIHLRLAALVKIAPLALSLAPAIHPAWPVLIPRLILVDTKQKCVDPFKKMDHASMEINVNLLMDSVNCEQSQDIPNTRQIYAGHITPQDFAPMDQDVISFIISKRLVANRFQRM